MGGFWEAKSVYRDFVMELSTKNRYFADERFLQIDFYGFTPITPYTKVTTLFISRVRRMLHNVEIPVYGIGNIQNEN